MYANVFIVLTNKASKLKHGAFILYIINMRYKTGNSNHRKITTDDHNCMYLTAILNAIFNVISLKDS